MRENNMLFNIEPHTDNSHSSTMEELRQDLENKMNISLETVKEYRREYIKELLRKNNIDESSVDIEEMLNCGIPEWVIELQEKNRIK